jgi:tetratricopeptide (TPR) repeat protein
VSCLDEDSVLALIDGTLALGARAAAERHLADCSACAELVAAAAGADVGAPPAREPALARGSAVGRYVILDLVGSGGMGEVYAAFDPQLNRKIALKLLHRPAEQPGPDADRDRLLREAKAIARLSHPNVVVVHDAGAIDGRVFLAMEFVDGTTLAAWLAEAPRGWREIRDAFAAAGDGLAAAHDAGLVHRDFKPQNVMVAGDGAVRVMDFGLAHDVSLGGGGEARVAAAADQPLTATGGALTATGQLLGTPLYMAPEQFLSRPTDARTDQFSFCVALYEALYGERPFAADSLVALAQAVTRGAVREPAHRGRVPGFLRRLLVRGLATDPAQRYPSMDALLADLRVDPGRRRRLAVATVAAAALLAAAAGGAERLATRSQRLCLASAAELTDVWEASGAGPRHDAIARAFAATGAGFAGPTSTLVASMLDGYARRWQAGYAGACQATRVRAGQSAEALALRMACLDEGRDALRALTDVFMRADTSVLVQAANAVRELPSLDRCDDVTRLTRAVPAGADPAQRARLASLRAALAEVKALSDTGQFPAARRKVTALTDAVRATGSGVLLAEVLERRAWIEERSGDPRAAAASMEEALWEAIAGHRDDLALACAAQLEGITGYHLGDQAAAERWARLGQTLFNRVGKGNERAAAWFLHNHGLLRQRRGELQGALADMQAALALKQGILSPDHPDVGVSWTNIGNVLIEMGRHAEALAAHQKALDIYRSAYGADSPLLAVVLANRGEVLSLLGRHQEAEADLRLAIERWRLQLGADHPWTAYALTALGKDLVADGRPHEAIAPLERAVAIRDRDEPNRDLAAESRFALARARWEAGGARAAALTLAASARDGYARLPAHAQQVADIDAWLATRR